MASGNMQNKNGLQYAYHSLMAYAYYQLGDKGMVQHHLMKVKMPIRNMNGPLGIIRLQTLTAIKNKLSLMEQDFDKAEQFYKGLVIFCRFSFSESGCKLLFRFDCLCSKRYLCSGTSFYNGY